MKTTLNTPTILCLMSLLMIAGTACQPAQNTEPTPGFEYKDNIEGKTTLVGLAQTRDKSPASGVTVYIRKNEQVVETTATDENGRFKVTAKIVGPVQLILNDGHGQGALMNIILFEGGENDAGTLIMDALERTSEIVTIPQIGFEERLSKEAGNYQYPVYNTDASKVYAARKKNPESNWSIVEISTADGQERVLTENVALEKYYATRFGSKRAVKEQFFELLLDRYLYYPYNFYDQKGQRSFGHVLFDVQTKTVVFDSLQDATVKYTSPSQGMIPVAINGKIYLPLNIGNKPVEDFPQQYQKRKIFFIFDTATQTIKRSKELGSYWHESLSLVSHNDQYIFYTSHALSGRHYSTHSTFMYDIQNDESVNLRSAGRGIAPNQNVISGDGQVVVIENFDFEQDMPSRPVTHIANMGDGSLTPFEWKMLEPKTHVNTMAVNSDGSKALVAAISQIQDDTAEFFVLDTAALKATPFQPGVTQDGTTYSLCDGAVGEKTTHNYCVFAYDAANKLYVRGIFKNAQNAWVGAEIQDATGTPSVLFYTLPNEDSWTELFAVPEHKTHDMTQKRVRVLRHEETGFSQIYMQGTQGLIQRSFMTADHHDVAFSKDGTRLFYFTVDPISGYEQLFQLDLNHLPNR